MVHVHCVMIAIIKVGVAFLFEPYTSLLCSNPGVPDYALVFFQQKQLQDWEQLVTCNNIVRLIPYLFE